MVKYGTCEDENQLRELWKICFDETDDFLNQFYDFFWKLDEGCVITDWEDRRIVSMIHSIPIKMGKQKLRYFYACGTNPAYRQRGIFSHMLKQAAVDEQRDGYIFLVPVQDKIAFYQHVGMQKTIITEFYEGSIVSENNQILNISKCSVTDYKRIRDQRNQHQAYIEWEKEAISFILSVFAKEGVVPIRFEAFGKEQILLGSVEEGVLEIIEMTLSVEELEALSGEILSYFACTRWIQKEYSIMYFGLPVEEPIYFGLTIG